MAIKKTALYSSLWASCDELRGGMDASQYKDYVLTLLFLKYISDKHKNDTDSLLDIPQGASFDDMVKLKGDKEVGDKINIIINKIAEANDLQGIINIADFNDTDKLGNGKEMTDRLTKLIGIFEGIDLGSNQAEGDDLLGDAYEYLMRHFATESGKSKGQFYTPAEVSQVLAKVLGINEQTSQDATVYDPTCGSGSLLLKVSAQAPRGLTIYGQEMDNATRALARMNTILHGAPHADIVQGNTLSSPYWKEANGQLKQFDFIVANPPFSQKNWTSGINLAEDPYNRFSWGTPPEKNGDYAFLLHIIKSLKSTGKGAVILPHGVLFRGNAEANIRQALINQGFIKGIIGLPANLFYGTGIPACIIIIDKQQANVRKGIFMIDASKGFIKDGNKNRLRSQDTHKVVSTFTQLLELPRYSRMVPLAEIVENDYNLNIPRYIDTSEVEDLQDLTAHLKGGIPNADLTALQAYWQVFPNLQASLFAPLRENYSQALVKSSEVKKTILAHPEFIQFASNSLKPFKTWCEQIKLAEIKRGDHPKQLIYKISEALLVAYQDSQLLDKYNIYQLLMDYWAETLQDDVYFITQEDWQKAGTIRALEVKKGEKLKETPDLIIDKAKYKAEVIPPGLIIARYFAKDQQQLDELQSKQDQVTQNLESYIDEHSAEEGLLNSALNDKDKVTKASVNDRLKLTTDQEEIAALKHVIELMATEVDAKKAVKEAEIALNTKAVKKYPTLTLAETKSLIVEDKWLASLQADIEAEVERIIQQLANRIKELEERYAEPLPQLEAQVDALSDKVKAHLKAMGLEW